MTTTRDGHQGVRSALVPVEGHATWHHRRCRRIAHLMSLQHPTREARLAALSGLVGRSVASTLDLTYPEARAVLNGLVRPS